MRSKLLVILFLFYSPLYATEYFVSKSGSDANSCATAQFGGSSAKLTINGVSGGTSCLASGDTLTIEAGTYVESIGIDDIPSGGGSWATATIIQRNASDTVILQPTSGVVLDLNNQWVIIDGLVIDGVNIGENVGIRLRTANGTVAHHIRITNCTVKNAGNSGILFYSTFPPNDEHHHEFLTNTVHDNGTDRYDHGVYAASRDHLIEGNTIYNNYGHGIHVYDGAQSVDNNTVRKNIIHNNGSRGILIGSGDNNVAYNNLVYDNGSTTTSYGIEVSFSSGDNNQVYNNTIVGNAKCIRVATGMTNSVVQNNICWGNTLNSIADDGTSSTIRNNMFTSPEFLDEEGRKLDITSSSSAIDAGVAIELVSDDILGTARPQGTNWDIGAYELVSRSDSEPPLESDDENTVLVANLMNGNNAFFDSRVYLWNPSASAGEVTIRIFTLPVAGGTAQELTKIPMHLGTLGAESGRNIRLAEDILAGGSYTDDGGNLTLEFTIGAGNVQGAARVYNRGQVEGKGLAFGTYPLQEIPAASGPNPTVLVANFMNGNNALVHSRVYLSNPSTSAGRMTVRVFSLSHTGNSLLLGEMDLGVLESSSARNIKLAEDILTPLGIPLPYTNDGGNLTLEFTIQAADVKGTAQVFSSDLAFGLYPLQEIPATSASNPTVLVANLMNSNSAALDSRAYLWNPSASAGEITVRVFTLPPSGGVARELTTTPLSLGTLGAKSARNVKLAEDILTPLGVLLPYTTDGGNLTLEFTIQAADVVGAAQVFESDFAFGTYPMQQIPSTSAGSPTVLVANSLNGNNAALDSRVYLWNPSLSAGNVTVRVFTLPLRGDLAKELTTRPLSLGTLGAKSARNIELAEDILTPLGIPLPYTTDGGNLTLEFTIQAADVVGAAQVFSSDFALGLAPLQVIQ